MTKLNDNGEESQRLLDEVEPAITGPHPGVGLRHRYTMEIGRDAALPLPKYPNMPI